MSHVINGTKLEEGYTIEYVTNPKRPGFKAHARYELYCGATTLEEYLETADKKFAKADLRYDEEHGYLKIFDEDGNWINEPKEK